MTVETQTVEDHNLEQITDPQLPAGSTFNPVTQTPTQEEMMQGQAVDPTAVAGETATAATPNQPDAAQVDAQQIGDQTPQGEAAQGELSEEARVQAAQQEGPSQQFQEAYNQGMAEIDDAVQADPRATVQHQYDRLMNNFDVANPPGWARASITAAEQRMAARGVGSSSMAGGAVTAAIMQAALPIAQQDAKMFETLKLTEIDKKSQMVMLKAGHLANLDMANLNNRQQAAVVNAQNFLQMDLANLNASQQMAVVNTQARVQTMLSDQAAVNAARQFNAASENETNQFFANLSAQIETFNAAQTNEMTQFNAELQDLREQFNVKNALLVEQSNVEYLRNVNTQNTARENEANFINSQNLLNISNTAMANAIQILRDREAMAFEAAQNGEERALRRAIADAQFSQNVDFADRQEKWALGSAVGEFASSILDGLLN